MRPTTRAMMPTVQRMAIFSTKPRISRMMPRIIMSCAPVQPVREPADVRRGCAVLVATQSAQEQQRRDDNREGLGGAVRLRQYKTRVPELLTPRAAGAVAAGPGHDLARDLSQLPPLR